MEGSLDQGQDFLGWSRLHIVYSLDLDCARRELNGEMDKETAPVQN